MKRNKRKNTIIVLLPLLICVFVLYELKANVNEQKTYNISVITGSKSDESAAALKEGTDQAANEMNADVRFISLSEKQEINEQKNLLYREIKNGADAILISPIEYKLIRDDIKDAEKRVPVIMLESGVNNEDGICSVSCDNYDMGLKIGSEILNNSPLGKKIVIVENEVTYDSEEERYEGLKAVLKAKKINYSVEKFSKSDINNYNACKRVFLFKEADIVVTFNSSILEKLADAKSKLINKNLIKRNVDLYGSGSTSKIISYMEEGTINKTALQNEFNIGYLGVKNAVDKINRKKVYGNIIQIHVIDSKNMYSKENQRLLFLFGK